MKGIFFVVASACLISELAASAINFPFEDEKDEVDASKGSFDIDNHLNIFYPDDGKAENLIVPFPSSVRWETSTGFPSSSSTPSPWTTSYPPWTTTSRPTSYPSTSTTSRPTSYPSTSTTSRPTSYPSTTPSSPTSSPWPSSTVTSTQKPRPTSTPWPRPPSSPKPRPGWNNPQIYDNAVRSLGPFASRLVNVVLNKQGAQKTVQENEILYNLRSLRRPRLADEENEN